MNKLIPFILLIVGVSQARAQQLHFKPADSLINQSLNKYLKSNPGTKELFKPDLKLDQTLTLLNRKTNTTDLDLQTFRDNMPIAVLQGNSRMPVARLEGYDNMPVKRINPLNANPVEVPQIIPGLKIPAEQPVPAPQK